MNRVILFWGSTVFIFVVGALVVTNYSGVTPKKDASVTISEEAVAKAKALYKKTAVSGVDLSSGPCISNDLMPGWVVDLVHFPREKVDDLPYNQCQAYLEGRAKHFVELDLSGNLVRVR